MFRYGLEIVNGTRYKNLIQDHLDDSPWKVARSLNVGFKQIVIPAIRKEIVKRKMLASRDVYNSFSAVIERTGGNYDKESPAVQLRNSSKHIGYVVGNGTSDRSIPHTPPIENLVLWARQKFPTVSRAKQRLIAIAAWRNIRVNGLALRPEIIEDPIDNAKPALAKRVYEALRSIT
jgi:hypothetical protein